MYRGRYILAILYYIFLQFEQIITILKYLIYIVCDNNIYFCIFAPSKYLMRYE